MNFDLEFHSPLQPIELSKDKSIQVFIKRDDLIHSEISGNKWRKLKYNLMQAKSKNIETILTFGGAYSNHIAATAAAGKLFGFKTIGMIRGEKSKQLNVTLLQAEKNGMSFNYISRSDYKNKKSYELKEELQNKFGNFYLIPEGGANFYGVNGCMEIMDEIDQPFDFIACPCGTGTTLAGIILKLKPDQKALGFSALKDGDFLKTEILNIIAEFLGDEKLALEYADKFEIITQYDFGGYAKHTQELLDFMKDFHTSHGLKTDPIYSGKMFFGLCDLLNKNYFKKGSRVVALHTGGLQGIKGFEERHRISIYN